jgi:hypothetical protein
MLGTGFTLVSRACTVEHLSRSYTDNGDAVLRSAIRPNFVGDHGKGTRAFVSMSDNGAPIQLIFYSFSCRKHEWREHPELSGAQAVPFRGLAGQQSRMLGIMRGCVSDRTVTARMVRCMGFDEYPDLHQRPLSGELTVNNE